MLDDDGVDFLGMRLAVVLLIAALLLSMAAVCVDNYADKASRERARQEARRIASLADAEYASGAAGSTAAISVSIPACVRCLSFGGNDSRTYSIGFADGSAEVYVSSCRFSPTVLYPGDHRLDVKLVEDGGNYSISLGEA